MGLVQACAELGTTLVAFSPVGRTLLTDRPLTFEAAQGLDFLKGNPRFLSPNYEANIAISADLGPMQRIIMSLQPVWQLPGCWRKENIYSLFLARDLLSI